MTEEQKKKRQEYNRRWREKNKEKVYAANKAWREDNREHVNAHAKSYRINNLDKFAKTRKKYYDSNTDKVQARNKAWRESNPDWEKEYGKAFHEKNKLPYHIVYALPHVQNDERAYCGVTDNPHNRMHVHRHDGNNTEGWFILGVFKDRGEALIAESEYHEQGYIGNGGWRGK